MFLDQVQAMGEGDSLLPALDTQETASNEAKGETLPSLLNYIIHGIQQYL